ncbi:DNA polymerase/3'-5' exonuclease PolX [Phytohalomonas tamaricis]|uniref:DNA polymerase/3'-5' exonuclease PolX n=1 Tax=Phytohalomonas tamaricis TaxID=2081032 RepID=UPI000D0B07A7|nr:DNA polymerase/3'-5' exonuclease PolX [Phytohalomonas tamaricis]
MQNADIARLLNRLADLLEIEGANAFRVRAYRSAAQSVEGLARSITDMLAKEEDLAALPGIGKDLAEKIATLANTGTLPALSEAEQRTPRGLLELLRISQLGPKRVKTLHDQLGIDSIEALRKAAREGKVSALSSFGKKTEEKILAEAERIDEREQRTRLDEAGQAADVLVAYMQQFDGVNRITVAGSYRRGRETVGDLDILVTCNNDQAVMDHFVAYDGVADVVSQGHTRATVHLHSGLQVDLRAVADESYGAALHYFTGSQAHNVSVRKMAAAKGLKINEYGVFKGDEQITARSEEEVFAQVGLPWIAPELRENRGEIEAAQQGKLPRLVTRDDIRGDLHMHTTASDGKASLREMAEAAQRLGYEYIAITDHSQRLTVANGLDIKRLRQQMEEIDALNAELTGITLLKSSEVDILEDGSLDFPDEVLRELDICICSVHSKFELSRARQTERVLRAMDNPYVNLIAHPTGRIINGREGYQLDIEAVLQGARTRGVHLEINAQPKRLDLRDIHVRMAKEVGVLLSIDTDAHSVAQLDNIGLGVSQARRGWLEKNDVLNTRTLAQLRKALKR